MRLTTIFINLIVMDQFKERARLCVDIMRNVLYSVERRAN